MGKPNIQPVTIDTVLTEYQPNPLPPSPPPQEGKVIDLTPFPPPPRKERSLTSHPHEGRSFSSHPPLDRKGHRPPTTPKKERSLTLHPQEGKVIDLPPPWTGKVIDLHSQEGKVIDPHPPPHPQGRKGH